MFVNDRAAPDGMLIRAALTRWAFNTVRRSIRRMAGRYRGP
jgi:hypothetical protein